MINWQYNMVNKMLKIMIKFMVMIILNLWWPLLYWKIYNSYLLVGRQQVLEV
jgi:hypothetical protein